jgi:uncharacterized protein (DUF302 family)
VQDTISCIDAAVKSRESFCFMVFSEVDHAAAGKKFGIEMRPRTVINFGNPKLGTPVMIKTPLLPIDNPVKALVGEDDQGKVWLSTIQPTICLRRSTHDIGWSHSRMLPSQIF